jgi:mersacidin/lichenicidin family type 2 lantibiotic
MIRAWRDPAYRASLSETERTQLPENPAGMIELTGTALDIVAGGWAKEPSKSSKSSRSHKSSKSSKSHKSSKSSKSHKSSRSRGSH